MRHDTSHRQVREFDARRQARVAAAVYRALASAPGRQAADAASALGARWQMLLEESPRRQQPASLARWRGRIDALALRTRYSDRRRHKASEPLAAPAQLLFSLLEQNRVEQLGARKLTGVHANLCALTLEKWLRARPEGIIRSADAAAWIETVALLARVPLGAPLPASALQVLRFSWSNWLSAQQVREIEALTGLVTDQAAYARQSLRVVAALLGPTTAKGDGPGDRERGEAQANEFEAQGPHGLADAGALGAARSGDPLAGMEMLISADDGGGQSTSLAQAQEWPAYRVFTTSFDQVVRAEQLCAAARLAQLRRELDQRAGGQLAGIARWAHRLQRRLMALQQRSWQFDRDDGLLDAARLTRLVTHPLEPLAYKQESEAAFPDTVISLLVDNSGSMRGSPIATAAICAELFSRVLERCGVKSEILGFTTGGWRGGRARTHWVACGRPAQPGRITELRHIIYKDADEPWRRARERLGLMLEPELLKENVDGEALLWAHERLLRRSERRRILLVISDGAPLDEATAEANDALYLERHLQTVTEWIETRSTVELAAVGIGHDVARYYRRAVTLPSADDLGEALVMQLLGLFDIRSRQ
jgi:cobaltochelatase CobT